MILAPLGVIALASVIGLVLWAVMIGALYALSSITGLAATAAGATGIVGFCWLCITELTKKPIWNASVSSVIKNDGSRTRRSSSATESR